MPGETNRDDSCLFCAIVAGTIPSTRVDEDERTVSFMDINPASDGHLLVVPRAHAADLTDITPEDLSACALTAQRLAGRQLVTLGADGVNLLHCCGEAAWQSVFHFHFHVIPRYADDAERDRLTLPWIPAAGDPGRISAAGRALQEGAGA